MGGRVTKMKEQKKVLEDLFLGIVSYALEVSVNGVIYVCVCNPFQVIRHILKFVNWQ